MIYNQTNSKKNRRLSIKFVSASIFGLIIAGFFVFRALPAMAQYGTVHDYYFMAGDGGQAAIMVDGGTKNYTNSIYYWYISSMGPDGLPFTFPTGATSPTFSGSDTLGGVYTLTNGFEYNGQISLDSAQASASGGHGGDVVINYSDGRIISNYNNASNATASRYIFVAGDGNAAGAGGNISLIAKEVTFGCYTAFFFYSGASGGGNAGGEVNVSIETLTLGSSFYGSYIFLEKKAGGGEVKSSLGNIISSGSHSGISYTNTSARYNTIESLTLNANSLTLYGRAGNRYNADMPWEFDQTGNYTVDGGTIIVNVTTATKILNIQAGSISPSSLVFSGLNNNNLVSYNWQIWPVEINGTTASANPNRPDLLAGESSLGVLDLRGMDVSNLLFTFSTSGSNSTLLSSAVGDTFRLIKGVQSDGTYLLADDYGTFLRNFGAQMYLFELDGTSGDLLLTYLGPDGGFTHFIKSYFEGHAAAVTTAVRGSQFISDSVIDNAKANSRLNMTTTSLSMGVSSLKTNTGSHVDGDNYNSALSGAYLFELGPGRMLLGAFVEAGKGDYDTYHTYNPEAPQENSGKANFFGGGAFLHYSFPIFGVDGFHVEASARAGKIDNKYDSVFNNSPVQFKNNNSYYGGHIGLGKAFFLSDQDMLDIYAKGFYTAVDSTGLKTSAKEDLEFDKVESVVSRLGTRYTRSWNDRVQSYIGGAWEHEFEGEVEGAYSGKRYNVGAELKGDSAFGEIGLSVKPLEIPLTLEANVFGKSGRQKGLGGALSLKYEY